MNPNHPWEKCQLALKEEGWVNEGGYWSYFSHPLHPRLIPFGWELMYEIPDGLSINELKYKDPRLVFAFTPTAAVPLPRKYFYPQLQLILNL